MRLVHRGHECHYMSSSLGLAADMLLRYRKKRARLYETPASFLMPNLFMIVSIHNSLLPSLMASSLAEALTFPLLVA